MARKKEMDKLSQDAAQASAAGMSYGKWKAMQTPVKIEPKKNPVRMEIQRCAWCGVEFIGDSRTKYCTRRCKQIRNNAHMVQKYREKVTQNNE